LLGVTEKPLITAARAANGTRVSLEATSVAVVPRLVAFFKQGRFAAIEGIKSFWLLTWTATCDQDGHEKGEDEDVQASS